MKTSDNVSYLVQSVSTSVGSPCTFTICPCNTNICRIRYDFNVSHFHLRGEASRSNQMLRSTWDTWLTAIDSIWMLLLLNKTHYSVPHHYRLQHLDHCTAAIKINRPDHNMHMYWTNFWQSTIAFIYNMYNKIFLKKLLLKFIVSIFTLLLAPFSLKFVNYSRHSVLVCLWSMPENRQIAII